MSIANRSTASIAAAVACTLALAGCTTYQSGQLPTQSSTATQTSSPNITAHESAPESPVFFGLEVPVGATQLGPLMRVRSAELVKAYQPELKAAEAERDAELAEANEGDDDDPTPTTPSPTPGGPPSDDSFALLDSQPRPDTVVSYMRIYGDPGDVTRRMAAQIAALLPDEKIDPRNLKNFCSTENDRVKRCLIDVNGPTSDERLVRVRMEVNPGQLKTRTSAPSSQREPVMTLFVQYIGDPVKGQAARQPIDLENVIDIDEIPDESELIWPRMDIDAPATTPLVNGWVAPEDTTILLSGFGPRFVVLNVGDRATASDEIARNWVAERISGKLAKDVVEDLNEVSTTYSGRSKSGALYRATHVVSARSNYVTLVIYPKDVL